MRNHRILIPALTLAATLIAAPAFAVEGGTSNEGEPVAIEETAPPAQVADPAPAPEEVAEVEEPAVEADPAPEADPSPAPEAEEPAPDIASSSDDDAPGASNEPAPPVLGNGEVERASEDAAIVAAAAAVTVNYLEIDPAAGTVEVLGTGEPGRTVDVSQTSPSTFKDLGTTVVGLDGTWSSGVVNTVDGRNISVNQYEEDGTPSLSDWAWAEIALSTDAKPNVRAAAQSIDPATMTATITGTGIPHAFISVYTEEGGPFMANVRADGTFSIPVSGLVWERNGVGVLHELQGLRSWTIIEFSIPNPGYVAATTTYTVVDAAKGMIALQGTGAQGAGIAVETPVGLVGEARVDAQGRWSLDMVNTHTFGLQFFTTQYLGITFMDRSSLSVTLPPVQQPAPAPVVAAVAAPIAAVPAVAPVAPVATARLAHTGADSLAPVGAAAAMAALAGAALLLGRRRLTARR